MIFLRKLEELLDTPYEVKQIPLYFWLEYFWQKYPSAFPEAKEDKANK